MSLASKIVVPVFLGDVSGVSRSDSRDIQPELILLIPFTNIGDSTAERVVLKSMIAPMS